MLGLIRIVFVIAAAALLLGGYAASQWAFFAGQAGDYATKVDSPTVSLLATVLLVGALALRFWPREEEETP